MNMDADRPGPAPPIPPNLGSVWTRPQPQRRQKEQLTRERIVAEALRLLDEEGMEALSMRSLGQRLGAGATSLYRHVASKDELIELVADAVYGEIDRGRLAPQSRLHVRNRFLSAYDGSPFRILADRDADSEVHASIGKTMRVSELALHMIAMSSNLATNLLLDLIGLETVQRTIERFGLTGLDIRRGVEDEKAFEHDIVNRVTANGLVGLLRLVAEERAYSPELSREMLDILHQQEFKKGIPARLPRDVRVAHKTGDISSVAHDAGVVYAPGRKPYVVAILTEWAADAGSRSPTIASISHAVYDYLRGTGQEGSDA